MAPRQGCASVSAVEFAIFDCLLSCNRIAGTLLGFGDAGLLSVDLVLGLCLGGCSFAAVALPGVLELVGRLRLVVAVARQQGWGGGRIF